MNWDTFYKQFQAKQPQITWDEYYKTLPIKAPVYTTEMLYNPKARPKTRYTDEDFAPLNIEWKFDWSKYAQYDETDPTEQLRKIRNVPPYAIISTYDFEDSEDRKRFEQGLPSKVLERQILTEQAKKEAQAYLQERQRRFEDILKQKQSEKILGIFPKKVGRIEPEEYEPEEIPATIAAWRGYQQALEEYQARLDEMTPEEYEYRKLIGALPEPPEPPLFEPPEEFKELDKDLWEEYIRKQEEERRKARQATSIPVTKRTEPPTSSTPTTPSPQSSGIEALKQTASEIKKPTIEKSPGLKFLEDFFKIDKDTIKKYTEATKEITSSDKVTWGDVLKNIYKSGVAKTGASYTKMVRALLGWLPDNIERFIYGGRTLAELQREMEQRAVEAETEMAEATPTQKFIYTGASESIPLLANFLLSRFLAAPSSAGKATTVAQKIGRVATGLAERAPYMTYFYGSYASEAEREGATPEQQVLYGIVGATIETVTEAPIVERMLGGGISKTIVNKMMKTGGKTLVNRLGRIGVETLFDIGLEAGQEILAGLGSNISKKLIYAPDTELINPQQIGEDAYGGMAMAVILSALGLPMRYKAHQMAEDIINSTAKGEKVTAQRIIELADQTKQDLNSMSPQEKAELTKTVTEEAKTVDEILQLPVPSEETVARMQFDNALNNIKEQLSTYTTQTDLDTETRNRIRDTVIANINIATQLSNQYGFQLPNFVKNAIQFLQQQPSTTTIEARAPQQTAIEQQPVAQQPVEQATIQQPAQETAQQPSKYAQYIGQQVNLKPPYGNVTVTGETDTHILVDKNGEQKRILKSAFDKLLIGTEQPTVAQITQTAPLPEQVQDEVPPDSVRALNVNEINVDPARFQFKADVDPKTGASRTLDIQEWNPYLAGVVLVWQDKDGRYWIVNGHHRLQKAKELGVETINAHVIREVDGYTDKDARELGAKINIAEGHGTITDAAKLFRDGGYTLERIKEEGLPLRSGNALKGLYLAQLNDNLFDKVVTKQLTEEKGAIIGEILPTDKGGINDAKQNYIWNKIKDMKVSAEEVREMAEMLKDTDAKPRVEQTLLGEMLVWDIADFDIKPKLIAETKSVIISNKNAFSKVLKNAKALKEAGNILVDEENIKRKDLLSQAITLIDNGKNRKGDPINEIFNKYVEQIKAGMSKSTAAEKAANEIVELIASGEYLRQVAPRKQRGQISMVGGSESEVQKGDSGQSEGVSGDTGKVPTTDTEAAATAEQPKIKAAEIEYPQTGNKELDALIKRRIDNEAFEIAMRELGYETLDDKAKAERGLKGAIAKSDFQAAEQRAKEKLINDKEFINSIITEWGQEQHNIRMQELANDYSKELWQIPKEAAQYRFANDVIGAERHREAVAQALKEGKPVPEEVLKDYPDLQQVSATFTAHPVEGQQIIEEDTTAQTSAKTVDKEAIIQQIEKLKQQIMMIEDNIKNNPQLAKERGWDKVKQQLQDQITELEDRLLADVDRIKQNGVGGLKEGYVPVNVKQLERIRRQIKDLQKKSKQLREQWGKLNKLLNTPDSKLTVEQRKQKAKISIPNMQEIEEEFLTYDTETIPELQRQAQLLERILRAKGTLTETGEVIKTTQTKSTLRQSTIEKSRNIESSIEQYITNVMDAAEVTASATSIEDFIRKYFDIPIGYGKFRERDVLGLYKVKPEVIRLKNPKALDVLYHELGHHLYYKMNLDTAPYEHELLALGEQTSAPSYSNEQKIKEGVAEFVRIFVINQDKAKEKAPQFYEYFVEQMKKQPKYGALIQVVMVATNQYINQDPVERLLSNIDFGEETRGTKVDLSRIYSMLFDDLHALQQTVHIMTGGGKINLAKNPFELAWLHRGWQGRAETFIEYGVVDENYNKVYKSLREILEPVKDELRDFVAYATAKHAKEWHERGLETGLYDHDINATLERFKDRGYDKVLEELVEFQNRVLYETLVKSGVLSEEAYNTMREVNKSYVPFYRVIEKANKGYKQGLEARQPIRRAKGSTRDIVNPLESIIKNIYLFTNIASRNEILKALADLSLEIPGGGRIMDKVVPRVKPQKVTLKQIEKTLEEAGVETDKINLDAVATFFTATGYTSKDKVVTVFRNGNPEYYEVFADDVYRILTGLDKEQTNTLLRLFNYPVRALRLGATTLSPEFALARNPIRDTFLAAVNSKHGFIPILDTVRGLSHVLGKSDDYYKVKAAGAMNSTLLTFDRKSLVQQLAEFAAKKDTKSQVKTVVTTPIRLLIAMADALEQGTRMGEALRVLEKYGRNAEGYRKAALAARDITLDFARSGTVSKQANQMIAFFNATMQGAEKMYRTFKEDPLGATVRAILYVTLPSVMLWFFNRDDERYKELPAWQRDLFWIIPGDKHLWRIPKPPLIGQLFGSFVERILTMVYEDDSEAVDGFVSNLVDDLTPSFIPTAMLPWIEVLANYDFFRKYPIVPQSEQSLLPAEQYSHYTSEFAKWVGRTFNISPRYVDHLIKGYFAGLGTTATATIDLMLEVMGLKDIQKPSKNLVETLPLVKGMVADTYRSHSVDQFYKEWKELEKRYATAKVKDKSMNLNRFEEGNKLRAMRKTAEKLSELRKEIEEIYNDPIKSADRKRTEIEKLQQEMTELAREALQ